MADPPPGDEARLWRRHRRWSLLGLFAASIWLVTMGAAVLGAGPPWLVVTWLPSAGVTILSWVMASRARKRIRTMQA